MRMLGSTIEQICCYFPPCAGPSVVRADLHYHAAYLDDALA